MKKIMLMPFLQISSGHHQVADAIKAWMEEAQPEAVFEKVDILSHSYGKAERLVSLVYLKWIHSFPAVYSFLYKKLACRSGKDKNEKRFLIYLMLFIPKMRRLIEEKKPDLIVCTHAFPSLLASRLKHAGQHSIPIVNVYTDYFINQLWGTKSIDHHLVGDQKLKEHLLEMGIDEHRIHVTGIPVHPVMKWTQEKKNRRSNLIVGIMGGSMGAGGIINFIKKLNPSGAIHYKVFCGKNQELFDFVKNKDNPLLFPVGYIQSREEMSRLYDDLDAVISKPGGVTVSECLTKNVPIFIYHKLPGQEEMNFQLLFSRGLVMDMLDWERTNVEEILLSYFASNEKQAVKQQEERNVEEMEKVLQQIIKDIVKVSSP
ncbi:MGDG synthase family glycosyltransferase [Pseudalkalibacillus caeni]|uniref:Glycosyltransferase n=1 Tax=Exobacillus caeni TaxID=2574798 RepID=A0A5R9F2D2_9BACL|nr:glycosyltransferase [Pseudalkalibacillus caeni]TLS35073.1 glycosyltransferase [Pseudalkalibacillus caeni]